jgi:hypothetical protein
MNVGEMNVGEMNVGEMNVGEMNVGEMNVGEMKMNVGETKCTFPGSFSKSHCRLAGLKPGVGSNANIRLKPVAINA